MKISHLLRFINVALLVIFSIAGNCQTIRTVVLDAGHGGKDPGTVNGRNYEKTINLAVVKAAGAILEKNPTIKVVYTRTDDQFIKVAQRSSIAMAAKADLFVSVHTNASPNKKAFGTETYIMGVDKGNDNLEVAMRENGVISLESDYSTAYEGYDPSSSESLIMFSLMQYSFSLESLEIASKLQKLYRSINRRDNGVRQAGFLVLWRNTMPSILTELGYLSNDEEAKYLLSKSGQTELARCVAASVEAYFEQADDGAVKNRNNVQRPTPKNTDEQTVAPTSPLFIAGTQSEEQNEKANSDGQEIRAVFAVQVRSAKDRVAVNSANFGPLVMQIIERKIEKNYKYTVGALLFYKEALLLQDRIRRYYPDAFVVAFDGSGRQITVTEARKLNDN